VSHAGRSDRARTRSSHAGSPVPSPPVAAQHRIPRAGRAGSRCANWPKVPALPVGGAGALCQLASTAVTCADRCCPRGHRPVRTGARPPLLGAARRQPRSTLPRHERAITNTVCATWR
jgi:hypothetical protein